MKYLRTTLATNFAARSGWLSRPLAKVDANSSYADKLQLVRAWLIEFDDDGLPFREIALDANDQVLFAGPNKRDYGFWVDTNLRFHDFTGEELSGQTFERFWVASGVSLP
jgi:hypothetical protein